MAKTTKHRDAAYWAHSNPDAGEKVCSSCKAAPTTARLCAGCTLELEEALTMLAAWADGPPPIHRRPVSKEGRLLPEVRSLPTETGGRRPSSIFDSPSGSASRGGTKSLARELDTPALHVANLMTRRNDVPLRRTRLGRIEADLVAGVRTWIAALHQVNVDAPRTVVTGHLLARGCTWLLWHVHDIATHRDAADAVAVFTSVAKRLEALVDLAADRVYVGPCWKIDDIAYCTIDDQIEYVAELQCGADMYAVPDAKVVVCRRCGQPYDVAECRAYMSANVGDVLATTAELAGALSQFGLEVAKGTIRVWADRGEITSHGSRPIGPKRTVPLYRVDQVLARALKQQERVEQRRKASA